MKRCIRRAAILCLTAVIMFSDAESFNYESYRTGNLDEILAQHRPKSGVDVFDFKKVALTVALVGYAEKCGLARLVALTMRMLPTIYPEGLCKTLSKAKCIRVESPKGAEVPFAIQNRVADFLPEEVPLGRKVKLYCVLMGMTSDGSLRW